MLKVPMSLVVLGCFSALLSQPPPVTPSPDPNVLEAFLQMHSSLITNSTPSIPSLWQKDLGLSDADFAKLGPICRDFVTQADSIRAEARVYAAKAKGSPDAATLNSFHARHLNVITTTASRMQKELSPVGAQTVLAFVNGPFRGAVTQVSVGKK